MCYMNPITPLHSAIDHAAAKSSLPLEWKVFPVCWMRLNNEIWWLSFVTLPVMNGFIDLELSSICSMILDVIRTKVSFQNFIVTTKHFDLKYIRMFKISDCWRNNRQRDDHPCAMYNYVCYSHNNSLDSLWCIKKVSLLHFVILQDIKSTLLYGFVQCDSSVNNLDLTAWFFHLSFSRLISIKDIIVAIESSWWNWLLIVFVGHFLDGDLDQTEIGKTSFGVRENTMSWWCYSRTRIKLCHLDSQIRGCIFVR